MEKKLNSIKLIIDDIQNEVIETTNYLNAIKSKNIKNLEKLVDKIDMYSVHDWNTGYGIKNKKDILNILFEIILEQNKRISKLEEIINSSSIDKSFPDIQDDGPDLHESECCDNNNHHDSKEL